MFYLSSALFKSTMLFYILSKSEDGESTPFISILFHPKLRQRGTAQKAFRKVLTKKKTKASVPKKYYSVQPIKAVFKKRCIS